ncbi:MAG: class I tRNA ligase family protein [Acidimicrobiales bacterium]
MVTGWPTCPRRRSTGAPGWSTILANEEVTAEGRSDIGNYPVFKRNMKQWMLRITAYADRLLDDLDALDWPEAIKIMQRNWIGRSSGATVRFSTVAGNIEVFTTRPDTLFGATFVVLSPEHPLVHELTTTDHAAEVEAYVAKAAATDEQDRADDTREKTGVFTGSYATNPINGDEIPVWIADYVLMGYGTGAIMAVPCGDQRDFEFATKFGLDIPPIQEPPASWFAEQGIEPTLDTASWPVACVGDAAYINSANDDLDLNGISSVAEGKERTNAWLEAHGVGESAITYRLRDWLFSRQRYWGEPFPIVYDADGRPHSVPDDQLPVTLPELEDFRPTCDGSQRRRHRTGAAAGTRHRMARRRTRPGRRPRHLSA